ncbi:conserved hypothetical protein [Sporisorium reilianum SRZ2]|uniref:Uncharacterized protein n=1 Tax=Sporisorium reilianum (strain SRZ2) TaxID=999809 RepID=E6ZXD5_SPORE|nr:conserved hypothetical protein [Sporisorium reilianum SRZ2]
MIQQHAPHVFTLSGSPHRVATRPPQQPPRSILKKSTSVPTSPSYTTPSSPLASPPLMSSASDPFAVSGYRPQQWSVIGIARAQKRRPSTAAKAETYNTSLTVTLLYMPTETLYAWPFSLSSPDAKGVCYETCSREQEGGAARVPPEGTMSTSLRVLADVIRCWMRIRRERSALAQHRGSTGSPTSGLGSPTTTSLDQVLDNDEVISDVIDTLRLYQLTPFERSIYLLRQNLPEQSTPEPADPSQQSEATSPRGRPQSSSSSSEGGSDDDRDSHHRSDSCASSQASTVEASPERPFHPKLAASPKLPKINTAVASRASADDDKTAVPQIRLVEATPQDSTYEERDRVLERATPSTARSSSFGSRSMDTVLEDASEALDADDGPATTDSGEVKFINIEACNRAEAEEVSSRKTATLPGSPANTETTSQPPASSSSNKTWRPSPTKVSFRDPFKGIQRSSSKPEIRVEAIEYGSPESLLTSTKIKSSKRPSLDGLRSIFGGRAKSQ